MKRAAAFAATIAIVIGLVAWAGAVVFYPKIGDAGVQAIVMSAGIAFMVQCLTFGVALALVPSSLILGWGAGMLARLFVLVIHGFLGVRLLGLSAEPALVSLAVFFFLTILIEPFFLPRPAPPSPDQKPPVRAS